MSTVRTSDYIRHIVDAASLAISYVEGMEEVDFVADPRTQQAVILNLIIIGEAATKLLQTDAAFTAQHAEIPWRSMRGMRNRIAHGYFEINLDVVWETTKTALPHPVIVLPSILENLCTGKDLNADGTK